MRQKIMKIRWINDDNNPANVITKKKPCYTLQELINTNIVNNIKTSN